MGPARCVVRALLLLSTGAAALLVAAGGAAQPASVLPAAETDAVPSGGDAADDPVVWVNELAPSLSLVIGTDKEFGLGVYDLAGNEVQLLPDGNLNNVDIRYRFPLGGQEVALVTAGERSADVLAVYAADPATQLLTDVAVGPILLGITIYGSCMYRSPVDGEFYFFGNSKDGEVEQWRLFDAGTGLVDAMLVRSFDVGDQVEGCVADDENAFFFIGEEDVGIWRYGAEPGAGVARIQIDSTGLGGNLTADVEGLSIYYTAGGGGYLLASSQGSSTFNLYDRSPPHAFVADFEIIENTPLGIDAVQGTDGIAVMNLALGAAFPNGLFVAQDDENPAANQNFKLVSWDDVANSMLPPLSVDASFDVHGLPEPGVLTGLLGGSATLLALRLRGPRPRARGRYFSSTLSSR